MKVTARANEFSPLFIQCSVLICISENQLDWDKYVCACAFMYNTSAHSSINNTPFFLMYGRDPVLNIDLLIQHDLENHIPAEDSGFYVQNLVTTLHAA
uniref:RNA-directed DNA polymerase n=1 Tax=Haemonchus contortus TaxID=6289 RepID=A0A7I4YU72_HAECO